MKHDEERIKNVNLYRESIERYEKGEITDDEFYEAEKKFFKSEKEFIERHSRVKDKQKTLKDILKKGEKNEE